jgi:hypothetical protein
MNMLGFEPGPLEQARDRAPATVAGGPRPSFASASEPAQRRSLRNSTGRRK